MFQANARKIATILTADDQASGDLDDVEKAGDDVAESGEQAEQSMLSLSRAIGLTAGAATTGAAALSLLVRQHGETEQTMARLATVSGATSEEMEQMHETAQQIGIDLPISMGQAAEALEQLSFAGFEAEEAIAAVDGVANLAVASGMQMGEAAQQTASALRMFGLEADETHQVTAAMAATFSNSAVSIEELGQAFEYVGPTASAAGISLQEVSAAVGVLGDNGIRASKAGTALNTTLQRLTSGSGQAEEALSQLGLSTDDFVDERGELEDLETIFSSIGDEMEELESDAERMAIATELAGDQGARALLPLLENTEELNEKLGDQFRSEVQESIGALAQLTDDELAGVEEALGMEIDREDVTPREVIEGLEALRDEGADAEEIATRLEAGLNLSGGAAQALASDLEDGETSTDELAESIGDATTASEIAASQMSTTAGMVEFMRSSFDALSFAVFTGAGPAISWFNERLANGINVLNNNERAAMALGAGLAGLTGAAGLLTIALGAAWVQTTGLALAQGALQGSFLASIAATYSKAGALGVLTGAATGAAGAIGTLTAVLMANPLGLIFMGIVAAVAALVAIWRTDFLGAGSAAGSVLSFLGDAASTTGAVLRELGGILFELGRIFLTLAGMITLAPIAVLLRIPDLVRSIGPEAADAARAIPGHIVDGLDSLGPMAYATPVLGPLLAARDILSDPGRWADAGRGLVSAFVSGIRDRADIVPDSVSDVAESARSLLPFSDAETGPLSDLSQSGAALVQTLAAGVEGEGGTLESALGGMLGSTPLGQAVGAASDAVGEATGGGDATEITVIIEEINAGGDSSEESIRASGEDLADVVIERIEELLARENNYEPA